MIEAKKIVKKFKSGSSEITVLKGVDFFVKDGEFISIIGRSGSGKSTLMYQLSLLDRPTSGSIEIGGKSADMLSDKERTIFRLFELGYVFQDYALIPELNAIENVMIPLLEQGINKFDAKKISAKVLDRVELSDKYNNLPNQLSGGEQQRVSIARAMGHRPKILFADEPTANLDNDTSLSILKTFKELHADGQTIIMVTHEPEYVQYTDRVVTLFDGEIVRNEKN
ncbi:ABC transporter ATP-binding protein [Candidatus Parcubacteria bacterium]|jgi:putative ABC transport system ATP-binding protein|nr:MAG: ABC transporter ATP-binding protein [Candidatus Parcubacteria bacterium]